MQKVYNRFPTMALQLYLIRHGQTEENLKNILQGHMPGHLTTEGINQAKHLRDELHDISFDAIYCSDLQRCVDTMQIINEVRQAPVIYTSLLRERDWGPFTGMDIREARPILDERAESVESMFERATRFLTIISKQYTDGCILAVSHGLFCRAISAVVLHTTIKMIPRMNNGEVRHLQINQLTALSHNDNPPQTDTGATDA